MDEAWDAFVAAVTAWPKGPADGEPSPGRPSERRWLLNRGSARTRWLFPLLRHKMVLLMLGGAVGTYARYWLSRWFNTQPWAQGFPYGTFVINVSGSFILAVAAVIILERLPPEHQDWYLLIGTGFCGGYTTFSTFEWETFKLVRDGSWQYALANAFGSLAAGFLGVLLAITLVNGLFPRR